MNKICLIPITLLLSCIYATALFGIPIITSLNPNHGTMNGGNEIIIEGSGFSGCTAVHFGSTPINKFIVLSDTSVKVIAPASHVGVQNVCVSTARGSSSQDHRSLYAFQSVSGAFVLNLSSHLTYVDLENKHITIPLVVPKACLLSNIVIAPNGTVAYITDGLDNKVYKISLCKNATIKESQSTFPSKIAFTPDSKKVYIVNQFSQYITPFDVATHQPGAPISILGMPSDIAIAPDGKTAFVVNTSENTLVPIDVRTNKTLTPIFLPAKEPYRIKITPDGKIAYVLCKGSDDVIIVDISTHSILGSPIQLGFKPNDLAISPFDKTAYVIKERAGDITPIVLGKDSEISTGYLPHHTAGHQIHSIAITPDGSTAWIVDLFNFLVPIDLATKTPGIPLVQPAETAFPSAIAIIPDQAPLATFTITHDTVIVNSRIDFDASSSVSPVGVIETYEWDFGDGKTMVTNNPKISHKYRSPGIYKVKLRVTNSAGTSTTQVFTGSTASNNGGPSALARHTIKVLSNKTPKPNPPSNFIGIINKTGEKSFLVTTWKSSPSKDVIAYRIYKDNKINKEVSAKSKLVYAHEIRNPLDVQKWSIVAVHSSGLESQHTPLEIFDNKLGNR